MYISGDEKICRNCLFTCYIFLKNIIEQKKVKWNSIFWIELNWESLFLRIPTSVNKFEFYQFKSEKFNIEFWILFQKWVRMAFLRIKRYIGINMPLKYSIITSTYKIFTVYIPIVDHSLIQDHPIKIQIEDPSKINQGK